MTTTFAWNSSEQVDLNAYLGKVLYTNGPVTDQPLGITRLGYRARKTSTPNQGTLAWAPPLFLVPLWNQRGQIDGSYFGDGKEFAILTNGDTVRVFWPAAWRAFLKRAPLRRSWHGSLTEDKADKSGGLYRRNRIYDPGTGRFTQEDPIGLAGGMNLYGFANGDPINFSDPFGLCTPAPLCPREYQPGVLGKTLIGLQAVARELWSENRETIVAVAATAASRGGGGRMGLRPNPNAAGPHSTFRTGPGGKTTHYETWQPQTNPKNPAPWESVVRVDVTGDPDFNKVTQKMVPTPHAHDPKATGGVRPANPTEIP